MLRIKKGQWILVEEIEFGNLINSPTQRFHSFKKPFLSKEIMIEAKRIAGNGTQAAIAEIRPLLRFSTPFL